VFVSIKGGSYARFRRALAGGNLTIVRAAAAELPHVDLADALRICVLLRGAEPQSYERAVVRWLGRYCLEREHVTLGEVRRAAELFDALPANPERAVRQLEALCR
jgi:hypothetical protein